MRGRLFVWNSRNTYLTRTPIWNSTFRTNCNFRHQLLSGAIQKKSGMKCKIITSRILCFADHILIFLNTSWCVNSNVIDELTEANLPSLLKELKIQYRPCPKCHCLAFFSMTLLLTSYLHGHLVNNIDIPSWTLHQKFLLLSHQSWKSPNLFPDYIHFIYPTSIFKILLHSVNLDC